MPKPLHPTSVTLWVLPHKCHPAGITPKPGWWLPWPWGHLRGRKQGHPHCRASSLVPMQEECPELHGTEGVGMLGTLGLVTCRHPMRRPIFSPRCTSICRSLISAWSSFPNFVPNFQNPGARSCSPEHRRAPSSHSLLGTPRCPWSQGGAITHLCPQSPSKLPPPGAARRGMAAGRR